MSLTGGTGSGMRGFEQGSSHSSLGPVEGGGGTQGVRGHIVHYIIMTSLTSATHSLDQSHFGGLGEAHGSAISLDLYGIPVTEHGYHLRGRRGRKGGRPVRSTDGRGRTVVRQSGSQCSSESR